MEPKKRKLTILAAVIESYVESGEPIGSKALAELLGNAVSSATLRNDMAALAEGGYLHQPHTSAGRIPTQRGYRMYVDQLMSLRTLPEDLMRSIDVGLTGYSMDPERFITEASKMLSGMTGMAAIATAPTAEDARVTGLELMPMSKHTCLLMIMIKPLVLKTRICRVAIPLTDQAIDGLTQILRTGFVGKRLSEINRMTMLNLQEQLGTLGEIIEPLLIAIRDAARGGREGRISINGQAFLLEHKAFSDNALRSMLSFVSNRDRLNSFICSAGGTINVLIGTETGITELSEASVITARYSSGMGASGWVGVIGPQRMNYSRIIPCIQYFSTAVGKVMGAMEVEEE